MNITSPLRCWVATNRGIKPAWCHTLSSISIWEWKIIKCTNACVHVCYRIYRHGTHETGCLWSLPSWWA
jgi:hypothetical protein